MITREHSAIDVAALLRPYLLLAGVAFVLGFSAYVAFGWALTPRFASAEALQAPASAPAVSKDLARARLI